MTRRIEPLEHPPDHVVDLPGSKSVTNRALLLAALAEGRSQLSGVLFADDTSAMLECVGVLGATVDVDEQTATVVIDGTAGSLLAGPRELDARQSGTTARFVAAALLAGRGRYRLDGDEQMRARPMAELVDALVALGATVESTDGGLPLSIEVAARPGGAVTLDASRTSQFASGLMMVGPLLDEGLTLDLVGTVVSQPYLDMTMRLMTAFGAEVDNTPTGYRVAPGCYRGRRYDIEPDASAASYFFGAAALTGGRITVPGLGTDALQGDVGFVDVLQAMGAEVEIDVHATTVTGRPLHGIDVDLRHLSDTVPTLAVVAAAASSPTTITGVGFIRVKESDRIGAVVTELRRLGVDAAEDDDGLTVVPGPHRTATVETYDDHRLAMAFALLGLRGPAVDIAGPGCVAKTFPDYFAVLDRLRSRPDRTATDESGSEEEDVGESELTVIAID
ncbi:MAG: 3-phosphoshikimate 1-carboxyvinyltransferase, partial [Acidimicrobiia bacterium]|nr:3-phosphoshikimate 1-carboxyvinyltransferase [Acidimicrobiia bacterium]